MSIRLCSGCSVSLPQGSVYYRFELRIQGEQDPVLMGVDGEAAELLERLEAEGDWARFEEEVLWRVQGELCPECRGRLRRAAEGFALEVV